MRISELSGATLLSVSGMSRMVDRLVRDGLVVRESCDEDGRGAEVALTATGRGRLRAARAGHLADVRREFLARFSDDELGGHGRLLVAHRAGRPRGLTRGDRREGAPDGLLPPRRGRACRPT